MQRFPNVLLRDTFLNSSAWWPTDCQWRANYKLLCVNILVIYFNCSVLQMTSIFQWMCDNGIYPFLCNHTTIATKRNNVWGGIEYRHDIPIISKQVLFILRVWSLLVTSKLHIRTNKTRTRDYCLCFTQDIEAFGTFAKFWNTKRIQKHLSL